MRWFSVTVVVLVLATVLVGPEAAQGTVSGDNGRIAFVKDVDGAGQIFMINPDGTDLYQVTSFTDVDGDFADFNYLTWSPPTLSDMGGSSCSCLGLLDRRFRPCPVKAGQLRVAHAQRQDHAPSEAGRQLVVGTPWGCS
jgi:hypothetical protein